jgi:hypothetical protein
VEVIYRIILVLSGYFAQLLRYTAPADARSTIVRLRSAGTASLAFEQNPALKIEKDDKKLKKKRQKVQKSYKKRKKRRKIEKNDSFCCVFSVKVAQRIQKALSVLKLARFLWGEIAFTK